MEDKGDKKSRRDKRSEEDRKGKSRSRGDRHRDRDGKEDRKSKDRSRASDGDRDRHRDRDRERKRDDDRGGSKKTSSSHKHSSSRSGSSRTKDRDEKSKEIFGDEKSKEKARRKGSAPAVPGAVAANDAGANDALIFGDDKSKEKARRKGSAPAVPGAVAENDEGANDTLIIYGDEKSKEKARRKGGDQAIVAKKKLASGSSPSPGSSRRKESGSSRRDRSRNVPAPPLHSNQKDVDVMQFEGNDDDDADPEADPTQKDNRAKKYAFVAFVIVAVVVGIVVWWVMANGKSDPVQEQVGPTPFKPPKEDLCSAVSKGLAVPGQSEASVRTYAVEMNLAVTPDWDLAALKSELEILTQRNVLPLFIGCGGEDGPIVIQNNRFVINNANVRLVTMDSPKSCNLGSQSLCSLTYIEMDLFLKDPEVSSDYILELIAFVFNHKGLLDVLDLLTPIEMIDTQREYQVLATAEPAPTRLPSSSPSIAEPPVDPISDKNCLNVAEGNPVEGQEDLALQEYDIFMDVTLGVFMNDLTSVTSELEEKLQRFLMPALVGCDPSQVLDNNENRRRTIEDLIINAVVEAEYVIGGMCLPESVPPCYQYVIHLDIFVSQLLASADFTVPLMSKFREAPLVARVGLLSPFVRIAVVDTVAQTPSAMPSFSSTKNPTSQAPSQTTTGLPSTSPSSVVSPTNSSPQPTPKITEQTPEPTSAPSVFPTRPPEPGVTPLPTQSPTKSPTKSPTRPPTKRPTRSPTTNSPTIEPSLRPTSTVTTSSPTPIPSLIPSLMPSGIPSAKPSAIPSSKPSGTPSSIPSAIPSSIPSAKPSAAPSPIPSLSPTSKPCILTNEILTAAVNKWFSDKTAAEAVYGKIGDWCFGADVTSMAYLFQSKSFNGDINITGWDVSGITDMSYMFYQAPDFNQDISGWDVSSVTTMEAMFSGASVFNQNIGGWGVSSVTNMKAMFNNAAAFNQKIGELWNVAKVTDMSGMFFGATAFNNDLSNWDLSSLQTMDGMFKGASSFNQDLCLWKSYFSSSAANPEPVTSATAAFLDTDCLSKEDPPVSICYQCP